MIGRPIPCAITPYKHVSWSNGKVNIYWLAENAETSVEQLERFYLKNLAPSAAKVRNVQSFGGS